MAVKDPLILATDVMLIPVEDLPADVRRQMACENGDHVITRQGSRTPSRLIDMPTAELLKEFRTPKTIVEAVIDYSRARRADPEETLEQAFPIIQRFIEERSLVAASSKEASQIAASFMTGDQFAACEVQSCIQVLEDTELYQVRGANGEYAALKVSRLGYEERVQHTFKQEIAVLKHLDGRVNSRLLDAGTSAGHQYLLTEWCTGVNAAVAAEELRQCPNSDDRGKLLMLCCSILEAYAHLHAQQVIHSDVHPRNVLVGSDGSVKIIDYGLARLNRGENEVDQQLRGGIGFFFEPEYAQASLVGSRPPKSSTLGEQYALAALLYFLFTGAHYLDFSLEKHEMLRQIAEDHPVPFSRWGVTPWPEVEKHLAQALRKNPSERFPSIATFVGAMRKIILTNGQSDPSVIGSRLPIEEVLNTVLQRVGLAGSLLDSGLATAPTGSVNFGAAGIAYALYRIACVRSGAALLSLADIWATKAASDIGCETAFYNSDNDLTPETIGQISPYHTASGIHCVQAFISHAMGDIVSQQRAIKAFIAASQAPCERLDLTLGRSGTLLACSLLLDVKPEGTVPDSTPLLELGNETMQIIWDKINALAPIQDCPEIMLGIAHGWAGMLYATMCWCRSSGRREIPSALEERLRQLAECAEPIGRGVHWRWMPRTQSGGRPIDFKYMPGWCHGSAGYVHLWMLAHQIFGDEAYLALAEKAAWNAWEDSGTSGILCCGLAGQAYGLLNIYKQTGEGIWLHRAQKLANRAAVSTKAMDEYPDSLYRGKLGVAVLAVDLSKPEAACMPFFEREGWSL